MIHDVLIIDTSTSQHAAYHFDSCILMREKATYSPQNYMHVAFVSIKKILFLSKVMPLLSPQNLRHIPRIIHLYCVANNLLVAVGAMTGMLYRLAVSAISFTFSEEPGTIIPDTPSFSTSQTENAKEFTSQLPERSYDQYHF